MDSKGIVALAKMEFYEAWAEAEKQEKEAAAQKAASSSVPRKRRRLPEPVACVPVTHDPYLVLEGPSKSSPASNFDDEQKQEEEESSSSDSDTSSTEDTSPVDGAGQNLDTEKNIPSESKAIEEKVTETKFDEDVPLKVTVMTERQDDVQRQMKKEEEEVKEVGEVKSEIKSEALLENLTNALLFAEVERVKAAAATEVPVPGSQGKWGKPPGPVPQPAQAVAPLAPASAKCGAVPKSKPPWRENNVVSAEPIASAPAPPLPPPSDPPPVDGSVRPRSPSQPPRDDRPRGPAGPQNEGYYYTFFSSRREYERLVRNQFRSRRGRNQRVP